MKDQHVTNATEVCGGQLKEDVCAQTPQTFTTCSNTSEAPEIDLMKADGEPLIILSESICIDGSHQILTQKPCLS